MDSHLPQFEALFRQFHVPLVRSALRWLREPEAAEELVQDVFVKIWEKRSELALDESLKSYLFTAVRNRAFNYLRDQARKGSTENIDDHIELGELDGDNLEYSELQRFVNEAINSLPPRCKAIFVLSREESLSYRQIAEELGVSVKTVEAQMSIALKRLRKYLSDRGVSWAWLCIVGLVPF